MKNENLIKLAIEEYNKYHSPEATAELKEIGKNFLKVKFSGPFCRSCGVSEWFEDLRIELEREGLKFKIKKYKQKNESFAVEFRAI